MPDEKKFLLDNLIISLVAFLGGIVSNIVYPQRRGAAGFIAAAVVGVFGGGVAGASGYYAGFTMGPVILITAGSSVFCDRFLVAVFMYLDSRKAPKVINIHNEVTGNQQQNVGEDVNGSVTNEASQRGEQDEQ